MKFTSLASSSRGNAYLLESDGASPLLLEVGLPIKQLRDKLRDQEVLLSDLEACLISHEHGDHSKAVKDLLRAGVDCYMSIGTANKLGVGGHHRLHPLFTEVTIGIPGDWLILSFPLEHDATEPFGFFIGHGDERLLFVADTELIKNRFEAPTIIAVETNYQEEILHENISKGYLPSIVGKRTRRNHMSLKTVKDFLLANDLSRCREIHLLHLSSGNSDEEAMRKEIQEITGIPVYIAQEQ